MALPPSIPTSFVPRAQAPRPVRLDFTGALFFVAIGIFIVSVIGAGAVFGYQTYLSGVKDKSDALVAQDEKSIDPSAIEAFVRLQQRIDTAHNLLNKHIAVSNLFGLFGQLTPLSVRFTGFKFDAGDGAAYKVSATGIAKNFNALAVASASFSSSSKIHNMIISNLGLNSKDGTVTFTLEADVDTAFVTASAAAAAAPPDAGTATASSTTL